MYVRIVTFQLEGLDDEAYAGLCHQVAPAFAEWEGLISKVWLADRETGTFGGTYLFESEADADRSRETEVFLAMSQNPGFAGLQIREFEVLDAPTRVTAGPLPVGAAT